MGWTNDAYYWYAEVEGHEAKVIVMAVSEVHARALVEQQGHKIVSIKAGPQVKKVREPAKKQASMFAGQFKRQGG